MSIKENLFFSLNKFIKLDSIEEAKSAAELIIQSNSLAEIKELYNSLSPDSQRILYLPPFINDPKLSKLFSALGLYYSYQSILNIILQQPTIYSDYKDKLRENVINHFCYRFQLGVLTLDSYKNYVFLLREIMADIAIKDSDKEYLINKLQQHPLLSNIMKSL